MPAPTPGPPRRNRIPPRNRAETTLHITGSKIHAMSENDDMYAAIDDMIDKLDRQVRKHKEKLTDHHRREGGIKQQQGAE